MCGDSPLAYRIGRELTGRYGENAVVLLPDRTRRRGRPRAASDRVIVLATRAGLSTVLAGNRPPSAR